MQLLFRKKNCSILIIMENIEELIRLFKEKPIFFPIGYVYIKKPIIIKEQHQ